METNGVAVAHHGLILSQDGATASRMLFKGLRALFYLIFGAKISKLDHWTKKYRKIRHFLLWSGPVYFLLYGEPWADGLAVFGGVSNSDVSKSTTKASKYCIELGVGLSCQRITIRT